MQVKNLLYFNVVSLLQVDRQGHIYNQYVQAFKEGVYDFVREEYDDYSQEIIPGKYFSGGIVGQKSVKGTAMLGDSEKTSSLLDSRNKEKVAVEIQVGENLTRPTGGAITIKSQGLRGEQEERIDELVRLDFEDGRAVDISDRLGDIDIDGIVSANEVVVWEIPRLAEMDKFLVAHSGRG